MADNQMAYDRSLFELTQNMFKFKDYLRSNGKTHLIDDRQTRSEFFLQLPEPGDRSASQMETDTVDNIAIKRDRRIQDSILHALRFEVQRLDGHTP